MQELVKDSNVSFLQLDSMEVAVQLTLRDYDIFKAIESTDYIDNLFELQPRQPNDRLKKFEEVRWNGLPVGINTLYITEYSSCMGELRI